VKVIDSSALVKYFTREEGWERVREAMLEGIVTLDLAVKELANTLWKKVMRNEMSLETARAVLRDIIEEKAIPVEGQDKYIAKAFNIAVEHGITVYDALFIVLAKESSLEFITSDKVQADVASKLGVKTMIV
jgi:predicted nucleic acid-binding protein